MPASPTSNNVRHRTISKKRTNDILSRLVKESGDISLINRNKYVGKNCAAEYGGEDYHKFDGIGTQLFAALGCRGDSTHQHIYHVIREGNDENILPSVGIEESNFHDYEIEDNDNEQSYCEFTFVRINPLALTDTRSISSLPSQGLNPVVFSFALLPTSSPSLPSLLRCISSSSYISTSIGVYRHLYKRCYLHLLMCINTWQPNKKWRLEG